MDPITIAIIGSLAVQGGSAIMQYLNSEEARKLTKRQIDALVSAANKMESPDFKPSDFTPEEQKYVAAVAPRLVEGTSVGATRGREAQMAALERLVQIGQGQDPYQQAVIQQAAEQASEAAESSRQAALQNMARRGTAGGGLELASALQGQAQAYKRAADVGLAGGMERYRQGLEALYRGADIGRQVRAEDVALEQANADVINRFNQANTAYARGLEAQRVSDINAAKQNYQQARQQQFQNQVALQQMRAGMTNQQIQNTLGAAQDRNQMIQGLGNVATGAIAAANPQRFNPVTGQAYYDPYSGKSMALPQEEVPQQKLPPPKELDASIYDKPYTV